MAAFWTDVYQRHFQRYFAKPFDIQIYHDATRASLKLATYDQARPGCRVFASMGMADRRADDADNDDENFGEVILCTDIPDNDVPAIFVNALFFILQNAIPLDSRFAIGFGPAGKGFEKRRGKVSLYFARATGPDDKFDKVRMGDAIGRVFEAHFLNREQDQFLEEYGPDEFEKEYLKHGRLSNSPLSVRQAPRER